MSVSAGTERSTVVSVPVGRSHKALIDASDRDLVVGLSWYLLRGHNGKLYAFTRVGTRITYMHRLIGGTPTGFETDHRNGDGLDNRRANLRTATASQNRANMGKPNIGRPASSRFKGVSWCRSRSKWQSKITVNGVCRNLGRYDSETDAARAYDWAAIVAWGEFARLNFVEAVA